MNSTNILDWSCQTPHGKRSKSQTALTLNTSLGKSCYYGYGRILLDVMQLKKSGAKVWDILMVRPLVVSVYHIITENPAVDIGEL